MEGVSPALAELDADRAVERLIEMCAELRSCAIVDDAGTVLAESAPNDWGRQVAALWRATEADGREAIQVHVADEAGELFAARAGGVTAVALTARFALASLMFCDLRAVLRDLLAAGERDAETAVMGGDG